MSYGVDTCRICGGSDFEQLSACEMMFGTREIFPYFYCNSCGCLQIERIPEAISRYYPDNYYSFNQKNEGSRAKAKRLLRKSLFRLTRSLPGKLRAMLASRYYRYSIVNTYIEECPNWSSPIIDIGAGDGKVVADLRAAGFANARGIDPYLTESVYDDSGLLVEKAALESVEGTHDVISFHHVLEHLADPLAALRFARARLTAGGKILARVPVTDGELFRIYRENWFQLDAPRHLHIFSRRSLDRLAADAGLRIGRYWCDATEWPYLYSEMYRQGAPLTEAKAYLARQSAASRRALRRRARAANAAGIGDQVSAIFEIVR